MIKLCMWIESDDKRLFWKIESLRILWLGRYDAMFQNNTVAERSVARLLLQLELLCENVGFEKIKHVEKI